jgi:hypothetical protein
MPHVSTEFGDALIFDGTNAAELAEAVGAATPPTPDDSGVIVLDVPHPPGGGRIAVPLTAGDGLIARPPGMYLPISAEQVATFTVAATPAGPGADSTA